MNRLIFLIAALVSVCAVAKKYSFDENEFEPVKKLTKGEQAKLSPEQLEEYKAGRRLYALHRNGGIFWLQGKGKLLVSVINNAVENKNISGCLKQIDESLHIKVEVTPITAEGFMIEKLSAAMKKFDAQLALFIVDKPELPMSLVAAEEGWALINVAKLKEGNPSKEKLDLRTRKAVARGFMMVLGGVSDTDTSSPLRPVRTVSDLDKIPVDWISFWNLPTMYDYMKGMGVTPATLTTYKRAVRAGVAPSPTNKWQKIIWDKEHQIPTKPITIDYIPKAQPQK